MGDVSLRCGADYWQHHSFQVTTPKLTHELQLMMNQQQCVNMRETYIG